MRTQLFVCETTTRPTNHFHIRNECRRWPTIHRSCNYGYAHAQITIYIPYIFVCYINFSAVTMTNNDVKYNFHAPRISNHILLAANDAQTIDEVETAGSRLPLTRSLCETRKRKKKKENQLNRRLIFLMHNTIIQTNCQNYCQMLIIAVDPMRTSQRLDYNSKLIAYNL